NGDTYLGGDDLDNMIVRYWMEQNGIDDLDPGFGEHVSKSLAQQLRVTAEEAKKHLTTNDMFDGVIDGKPVRITREHFNGLIQPLVDRTITACANAIKD